MSEKEKKELTTPEREEDKVTDPNKRGLVSWLMILLIIITLGPASVSFLKLRKLELSTASEKSELLGSEMRIAQLEKLIKKQQTESVDVKSELDTLKSQNEENAEQLLSLYAKQATGSNELLLAEIEHLLVVAEHRLQLEADAQLALAALNAADRRLRAYHDPGILAVRKQLTADINNLAAVQNVDINGLVLYLGDLGERALDLALLEPRVVGEKESTKEETLETPGKWQTFKNAAWKEIQGLVQISRRGEQTPATLLPEQRYFLFQNLRLQIESARYAALRRNTDSFQASIGILIEWLESYFDLEDRSVANVHDSLSKMTGLDLQPPLPDISSSLESLRAYQRSKNDSGGEEQTPQLSEQE